MGSDANNNIQEYFIHFKYSHKVMFDFNVRKKNIIFYK